MKRSLMWKHVAPLFTAALLVFLAGCAQTTFTGPRDYGVACPAAVAPEIPAFAYDPKPVSIKLEVKEETDKYTVYLIKFRAKDFGNLDSDNARAFYFVQKDQSRPSPVLLALPPTGGPMSLAKSFAEYYAQQGFTTMAFYRRRQFFNPCKDLEYNVNLIRQSVIDVRRALDYLEKQPNVDMNRVAVMGVSLGGIIGALVTEADGRVKATASLIAAGSLPVILETSHYGRVARFRDATIARYGLKDREDLLRFAGPALATVDPITYADRVDPARMLMINGYQDNIVNIRAARDTWHAFGKPEWRTLPVGHYSSFILIHQAKVWTMEHFRRVLNIPA